MQYTQQQINNIIINKGFIPLNFKWQGYNSDIDFQDNLGYKYRISWSRFNRSDFKNPKALLNTNAYYLDNLKNYLKLNNIEFEIMNELPPKSCFDELILKCKCGHFIKRDWSHLIYHTNKNGLCEKCYRKSKPRKDKISNNSFITMFEKYGFTILENLNDGKIRKNNTLIEVKDKNGYKGFITYANIQQRKEKAIISPFHKSNKWSIFNIRIFFQNNNIDTKVISEVYKGYDSKVKFQCQCGEVFERVFPNSHDLYMCYKCSHKQSYYEKIVENWLKNNNIEYISEKIFNDCKNQHLLPFDFYIPAKNICIEVQGEQHYKPIRFGGISQLQAELNLISQKERDLIKQSYCLNNNITLIYINYIDIKTENYKSILKNI